MNILLPYPDSLNRHWRYDRGIVHISTSGQIYRDKIVTLCRLEKIPTIDYPVRVELWAAPPDKRRRDLDNLTKAVLDALTVAKVWGDDSQVKQLSISWCMPEKKKPCVIACINHFLGQSIPAPLVLLELKKMNRTIYGAKTK